MAPDVRSALTRSGAKPHSCSAESVSAPGLTGAPCTAVGVRLKRGAGAGCGAPADVDEHLARHVVRMRARFRHRKHGCEAHLVTGEERDPLVACAGAEEVARGAPSSAGHCAMSICVRGLEIVEAERPMRRRKFA